MKISEFQDLIKKTYFIRDSKRAPQKNILKLIEEFGEFAEALLENDKKKIEEETADLVAWITSLLNIYHVDLEQALKSKYGDGCPNCKSIPCKCNEF